MATMTRANPYQDRRATGFFEGALVWVVRLAAQPRGSAAWCRFRAPRTSDQIAATTGMPRSEVQATLSETAQRVEEKAKSSGALQQNGAMAGRRNPAKEARA